MSFLIHSSIFFRDEELKTEIKALEKQLRDVKKETETELQVRSVNNGHHAGGKPVSEVTSAARS